MKNKAHDFMRKRFFFAGFTLFWVSLLFVSNCFGLLRGHVDPESVLRKLPPPVVDYSHATHSILNQNFRPPENFSEESQPQPPKFPLLKLNQPSKLFKKAVLEGISSQSTFTVELFENDNKKENTSSETLISNPLQNQNHKLPEYSPSFAASQAPVLGTITSVLSATRTSRIKAKKKRSPDEIASRSISLANLVVPTSEISTLTSIIATEPKIIIPVNPTSSLLLFSENATNTLTPAEIKVADNPSEGPSPITQKSLASEIAKNLPLPVTTDSDPASTSLSSPEQDENHPNISSKTTLAEEAFLAKLELLKKERKIREIISEINDHPEFSESMQVQEYNLEGILDQPSPNILMVKRIADGLFEKNSKNPLANYGLGYYYYYSKKPNLDKALFHVKVARAAKNIPEGASNLYWKITLKKRWLFVVIFVAGLIGLADFQRKKRASQSLDSLSSSLAEPHIEVIQEPSQQNLFSKLYNKIKTLVSKKEKIPEIDISISSEPNATPLEEIKQSTIQPTENTNASNSGQAQ